MRHPEDAWRGLPHWAMDDAASLLSTLGDAEQARAAALALTDPSRQARVLTRIVQAALDARDLTEAELTRDLIADPSKRNGLLPSFISAHLRDGDHVAALAAAQHAPEAEISSGLLTALTREAIREDAFDVAAALVQAARTHGLQVSLQLEVAQAAVESLSHLNAKSYLEAAEATARSAPDPSWRSKVLAEAAWAALPGSDFNRLGMLTAVSEVAARQIPDAATRAEALVNVAAVIAVVGDQERADKIFEEAVQTSSIPCAWAENLAARAQAEADRGHHHTARAQVSAVGTLERWITEPNNRIRAVQARLAAAIHVGDLAQAEDAARAVEHPDQQARALIDVARALAADGQAERAIELALTIDTEERQADALSEVSRLTAALGEFRLAERAAGAITVRGGRSPALLSVAWEAARTGNLALAERIVASITDRAWHALGLYAIHAQRFTLPVVPPRPEAANSATDLESETRDLLSRVDANPDGPSATRLLAQALRDGPLMPVLATLCRVDPQAVLAAADALLTLLR